jgi:hypothetical protein
MSQTGAMLTQGDVIDIGLRAIPGTSPTRYEFYNKETGSNAIFDMTVANIQPGDHFIITFRYTHEQVKGLDFKRPTSVWFLARQIEDRKNPTFPIYIPLDAGEWDGESAGPRDDTGNPYTKGDYPPNLADKFQYMTFTNVIRKGNNVYDVLRPGYPDNRLVPDSHLTDTTVLLNTLNSVNQEKTGWLSIWDRDNHDKQLLNVSLLEGDTLYIYYYLYWDGHGFWQDGRYYSPVAPDAKGSESIEGTGVLHRQDNDYMDTGMRLEWRMGMSGDDSTNPPKPEPEDNRPPDKPKDTESPPGPTRPEEHPKEVGGITKEPDKPKDGQGTDIPPVRPPLSFPKTGDDSSIALWVIMLTVSIVGAFVVLLTGRKKKEEKR